MVAFLLGQVSSLCVGLGGGVSTLLHSREAMASRALSCSQQHTARQIGYLPFTEPDSMEVSTGFSSCFCLFTRQQGLQQSTVIAGGWNSQALVASSSLLLKPFRSQVFGGRSRQIYSWRPVGLHSETLSQTKPNQTNF